MDIETQRAKAEALRELHKGPEILILPNAWDVGSARFLAGAGFSAMGTTSAGIAFALGYPDGERISREQMLDVVGRITAAVPLPVTADIEAGYGPSPEAVAESVNMAIEAGAVGINIEDSTGCASDPLFEIALAVERIRAARKAANAAGVPLVINARTDGYMVNGGNGEDVFEESVRRASAYRAAGADCLFVPMVGDAPTIGQLVERIDGPVNVLAGPTTVPVAELQALGVARVSIGSSLARAAYGLMKRAAEELLGPGTFDFTKDAVPFADINRMFDR